MNKIIALLFLTSPLFGGQNLTIEQIQTIQKQSQAIKDCSDKLLSFSLFVGTLTQNNYTFTVSWSTDTVTLTPKQQTDMQTFYQNLKLNCLQNAMNLLP